MKQYKHLKTWRIAKPDENSWYWYNIRKVNGNVSSMSWKSTDYSKDGKIIERYRIVPSEIIENSQDREEVKEPDIFEKIHNEFLEYDACWNLEERENIKRIIIKNLGITRKEINSIINNPENTWKQYIDIIWKLFEDRWLLIWD